MFSGEGADEHCIWVEINDGMVPFMRKVQEFARLDGALPRLFVGWQKRIDGFHPVAGTLVSMVSHGRFFRGCRIENPMFSAVQGFGKAWAVGMPLNARSRIAHPKGQCHIVTTDLTGWKNIMLE
eukprot:scaffold16997_cov54-Attheya_sp.AAC.1